MKTPPKDSAPWPWKVVKLGPNTAPIYYILGFDGREVARFFGPLAQQHCDHVMELAAEHQIFLRKQAYNQTYGTPVKPIKQLV